MGAVRIRGGFELRMDSPASSMALASTVIMHVYDCGEVIGDETQRCEIVSGAAVHGRAASVPKDYTPQVMLDGYKANSALYMEAEVMGAQSSATSRHKMPTSVYSSTLAHLGTLQADESLLKIEAAAVTAAVTKSSEVAPFIGAVLAQPCAMDHAEVKIFMDGDGRVAWHVGITSECLDTADSKLLRENVPVVFRYYDKNHAYAAKIVKTVINGRTVEYDESHSVIDHDQWQGMRLGELKALTDRLELSIGVTYFAVKSVEQTLSREKWEAPAYVTQPQEAADVGGQLMEGKRGIRAVRQPRLTASAISMMLIAVAGLSTMSMGSECFGLDANPEQLYFAGDVASVWPENADGDLQISLVICLQKDKAATQRWILWSMLKCGRCGAQRCRMRRSMACLWMSCTMLISGVSSLL